MSKTKKKHTPHLDFYMKYAQSEIMPNCGLCIHSSYYPEGEEMNEELIELFEPSEKQQEKLREAGFCTSYWGNRIPYPVYDYFDESKNNVSDYEDYYEFTDAIKQEFNEFRQTVVLLCAAMNDEL